MPLDVIFEEAGIAKVAEENHGEVFAQVALYFLVDLGTFFGVSFFEPSSQKLIHFLTAVASVVHAAICTKFCVNV